MKIASAESGVQRQSVGTAFKYIVKNYPLVLILIVFVVLVSFFEKNYFTATNFLNILRQIAPVGIISVGMTFIIISGTIDLSVGSLMSLLGPFLVPNCRLLGFPISLVMTLVLGAFIGAITGFIIKLVNGKMGESFIITFGMLTIIAAAALLYTGGFFQEKAGSDFYLMLGSGITPMWIFLGILLISQFILVKTKLGRNLYFVGGNPDVARLSGINIGKYRVVTFAISGFLAAIAGILMSAKIGTAMPSQGSGYEMDAIAACVVGGVTLGGGKGNMLNTLLGVAIMGVLNNALNMVDISVYFQFVAKGIVIILAVTFDSINHRKERRE